MQRIFPRTGLTSWSARAVLADFDWGMRCRFPLVSVAEAQRRPDISLDFIAQLRSLPAFERYRYARTGGVNDIRAELSLQCPVPPRATQVELLAQTHALVEENMKLFRSAQEEQRTGLDVLERALRIYRRERRMFGPFVLGSADGIPSWSARVSCSVRTWECHMVRRTLGNILRAPINRNRQGPLGFDRENGAVAVVCLKGGEVGRGELKNVPPKTELTDLQSQRWREVPEGSVLLCLRHQGSLRYWLNDGSLHAPVVIESRDFAVLDPNEVWVDSRFLSLVFRLDYVYDQVRLLSTGANIGRIVLSRLPLVSLPIPEVGVQQEIVRQVEPYFRSARETLARIGENKRRSVRQWERRLFNEN